MSEWNEQCSHVGHISADHNGIKYCNNCGAREDDRTDPPDAPASDCDHQWEPWKDTVICAECGRTFAEVGGPQ